MGLIFDKEVFKILVVFSLEPGRKFTRKELKLNTSANNVPLDVALAKLTASQILIKEYRKYRLNTEMNIMKLVEVVKKEHEKLKLIPLNVYFSVMEVTSKLARQNCNIHLFGSYSKLNFNVDSDVDLAVVSDQKLDFSFVNAIEKKYGKQIQIHELGPEIYKKRNDLFVRDVLDGTRVLGNLKL